MDEGSVSSIPRRKSSNRAVPYGLIRLVPFERVQCLNRLPPISACVNEELAVRSLAAPTRAIDCQHSSNISPAISCARGSSANCRDAAVWATNPSFGSQKHRCQAIAKRSIRRRSSSGSRHSSDSWVKDTEPWMGTLKAIPYLYIACRLVPLNYHLHQLRDVIREPASRSFGHIRQVATAKLSLARGLEARLRLRGLLCGHRRYRWLLGGYLNLVGRRHGRMERADRGIQGTGLLWPCWWISQPRGAPFWWCSWLFRLLVEKTNDRIAGMLVEMICHVS